MATILNIADSIVAQLNAASLSQPITAVRSYLPRYELTAMQSLHVTVVPRSVISVQLDRARNSFRYQIEIAIQQKVDPASSQLDALMQLVEEIVDLLQTEPLMSFPSARCLEVQNDPIYASEHLSELGQLTSLITATYQVAR